MPSCLALFILIAFSAVVTCSSSVEVSDDDVSMIQNDQETLSRSSHAPYGVELNPVKVKEAKKDYTNINVEIILKDSPCHGAATTSTFTVIVGNLSPDNVLTSSVLFRSEDMYYDFVEMTHWDMMTVPANDLLSCIKKSGSNCFPRGDVIFIEFDNNPRDGWSLEKIEFNVYVALGPKERDHHKFHFELSNMHPCTNWMDQFGTYQIGPIDGLFLLLGKDEEPEMFKRVRDF